MKPWGEIDHTADAGIRASGKDLRELFENMARGMFELLVDIEGVEPEMERSIDVESESREGLLVAWLSEINFLATTKEEVYCDVAIGSISDRRVTGTLRGARLDRTRHAAHGEIKAVTYHDLSIRESQGGFEAQVILDL